jgi:shikimate kinase
VGSNIALVGFMGCGKTTVGRLLARDTGGQFVDTDAEIERAAGTDIPTLFRAEGETAFRDRETAAIRAACAGVGRVIATGGGAVLRPENVALLRAGAYVVWLTARPDVVVARVGAGAEKRPVLARGASDLLTHVLTLLGERGPLYQAAAHLVVDTSDRAPSQIAGEIARKYEREGRAG